jgi:anti-sigma B factor antagonist
VADLDDTPADNDDHARSRVTVRVIAQESEVVTVAVAGQLDLSSEAVLRDGLQLAMAGNPTEIIFDVTELTFMDSSGLAQLLIAAQQVDSVQLRNPSDIIRRLITISGLTDTLRLAP